MRVILKGDANYAIINHYKKKMEVSKMADYSKKGKEWDIFKLDFPYKKKLLYSTHYEIKQDKQIVQERTAYYLKAHGKFYRISLGEELECEELGGLCEDDFDNIVGIAEGIDIEVSDLDEMFEKRQEYNEKLKPANKENIKALKESIPNLIMEDIYRASAGETFESLKRELEEQHRENPEDIKNALSAMLKQIKMDRDSENIRDFKRETNEYATTIKRGEIWWVDITRGVGREMQGGRTVIVISSDKGCEASPIITCIVMQKQQVRDENYQEKVLPEDLQSGRITEECRAELSGIVTLDRARFKNKKGTLKPEKFEQILGRVRDLYEFPDRS